MNVAANQSNILDKAGMPSHLFWGYLGVIIFMMGDGLEIGWLSPYLVDQGLSVSHAGFLFTAYGITVAISSWLSGVLFEAFGAKKTMLMGLIVYLIGTIGFVGFAIPNLWYPLMLLTYAIRGFGYPLFAFSFLVWIAYRTPSKQLGRAVGWFWFVFTGGLNVVGAYYSIWAIENLGHINTLWTAALWVSLGAVFALLLNKDKIEESTNDDEESKSKELLKGITILKNEPKVAMAGIVRVINQTAQYAFPIFLPTYLAGYGFDTSLWLSIWGSIFVANIVFNIVFGVLGDKMGWRNTVMWFGGVGCGVFTLVMYYVPQIFGDNMFLLATAGLIWGACLAGYVPLSALVPSLVNDDKGAAMSILNLGAGLCVFVGPLVVALTYDFIGAGGVMWVLACLYFGGAFMTKFITLPGNKKTVEVFEEKGA